MFKRFFILFLLFTISYCNVVGPKIYEQKDFGTVSKEQFTYSISVDCTAATVNVIAMDSNNKVVRDANTYLKYIDFAQPLISSVKTDTDGKAVHKLPGNVKLMTGFFILVIEKPEFRNKEIHFDIGRCFGKVYPEEEPEEVEEPEEPAVVEPEAQPEEPEEIEEPQEETDVSEEMPEEQENEDFVCPGIFMLPLILFKIHLIQSRS